MPWFRAPTKLHREATTRRLLRSGATKRRDAAALGLWMLAGSWAAQHSPDGFVPADELHRWDDNPGPLALRLVRAGFWQATGLNGVPGYEFVDWDVLHLAHFPRRSLPQATRMAVLRRDRGICGICWRPVDPDDFHVDHIYPVILGGSDAMDNLQTAHPLCNLVKGASV